MKVKIKANAFDSSCQDSTLLHELWKPVLSEFFKEQSQCVVTNSNIMRTYLKPQNKVYAHPKSACGPICFVWTI